VLGSWALTTTLGGKLLIEYGVDIAKTLDIPICATAHTKKKLLELGVEPASSYDIIEIINHLKDPAWKGVKKEGNHDLVMFLGFRTDLGEQGLSTLKHYAPHLKTMTLCKFYYPHASYSLPNFKKDEQWKEFLDNLITNLKSKEA
jgi:acetyl-CoA decarbonylase/synthase complex subunit epsilon